MPAKPLRRRLAITIAVAALLLAATNVGTGGGVGLLRVNPSPVVLFLDEGDMGAPAEATPTIIYFPVILRYSPLPDLVVQGMRIELETGGSCSFTSSRLGLRVTVANMGDADAGAFVIDANGRQQTVSGLAAGSSISVWFPHYQFSENTAVVDATSLVAERNEQNNTLTQVLPIPTLPPPCTSTPTPTGTPMPTATPTGTPTLPAM